jgi:hypothetical protein
MEQNLFYVNKETSQHIQISAGPSTSTASHDSQLRVDSSHQVIMPLTHLWLLTIPMLIILVFRLLCLLSLSLIMNS